MTNPKKALGQHWLKDIATLEAICQAADLKNDDTVLEIGPGLGDLTRQLVLHAGTVIAVELDKELAERLPKVVGAPNLEVINDDILKIDLTQMPVGYKVVANIPYYLTSNLIRILCESGNPPTTAVLLVQKEVAERIAAEPGQMSLLSVSAQLYFSPKLGPVVSAELFEPPPKVDSQVIILKRRSKPLFEKLDTRIFFRIVKAGFAGRRKKLRGSLSAGLNISKEQADRLLESAGIDGDLRAQNLSLQDWHKLYLIYQEF
ncbi:MAG TPA: 16S rRNA (adenine(1518)-N(6)/adenine(1519)-N(6))-dimethyltransferase RsmA [Candidatus Saccharimonadales bacterium]|nr:16S rRNA (adenine(1518)-N(6)/adenine(1519)-N(6))-dimethyltransferase RsmA [Candidatus Saccharimonadales bacterium]